MCKFVTVVHNFQGRMLIELLSASISAFEADQAAGLKEHSIEST